MTILKCKMCGGDLRQREDQPLGTCDSCGSTSTLPRVSDEQRANLFNRANFFRLHGEFDKAIAAYENILNLDNTDAEAHWGVVLSRYGIEYVLDPAGGKRVPVCHRVQLESILTDIDYVAAIDHAQDGYSRRLYQEQAQQIAEIQKGILSLSEREQAYDVFICYKETDQFGARSQDSVLAQDLYYELNREGYRVFFARITLDDKLGQQYEPYIFAALNSAKVMVVIGTQPDHFNAIWVKNEWSRFLSLMKKDRSKVLIPCYKGMSPYLLPEALSAFQSQDMDRIGFLQDLSRGIKKLLDADKREQIPKDALRPTGPTVSSLLKRGYINLEDARWMDAETVFEQVLATEPENGEAYIGKMYALLKFRHDEDFAASGLDVTSTPEYRRAMMYLSTDRKQHFEKVAEDNKRHAELSAARQEELQSIRSQLAQKALEKESINKTLQKEQGELRNCKGLIREKELKEKALNRLRMRRRSSLLLGLIFAVAFLMVYINYERTGNSSYSGYKYLTSGFGDIMIIVSSLSLAVVFLLKGIFGNGDKFDSARNSVKTLRQRVHDSRTEADIKASIHSLAQKINKCEDSIRQFREAEAKLL